MACCKGSAGTANLGLSSGVLHARAWLLARPAAAEAPHLACIPGVPPCEAAAHELLTTHQPVPAALSAALAQMTADELLAMAATVEASSEHPLGRAVLEYANSRLSPVPEHRGSLDAELGAALGEEDGWDQDPVSVRLPSRQSRAAPSWQLPIKESEAHAGAGSQSSSAWGGLAASVRLL